MAMLQIKQEFMVACITLYQYLIARGNITPNEQLFIDALAQTSFINRANIESYNALHTNQANQEENP